MRVVSVCLLAGGLTALLGVVGAFSCNSATAPARAKPRQAETAVNSEKQSPTSRPSLPPLSDEEKRIIVDKGTERAFTGKYWNHHEAGAYLCRQCGATLYRSESKFRSDCGWPSFDDEVDGAVTRKPDADGMRTEILCTACGGHLGHVFKGEQLTPKNVRHCVNSASLVFRSVKELEAAKAAAKKAPAAEAIFAGGCFWGVEHFFQHTEGVLSAVSGYIGGKTQAPTYEQICTGRTGHAEAVRVTFDPKRVSYEQLARLFFEIHDPTELNRQGPDVGTQYRSAVFYVDERQKQTAEKLLALLRKNGYKPVTQVVPAERFYPAEDYHQDFIKKHPTRPICHARVPRFDQSAK